MKKIIVLLLLFSIIATPSYALNLLEIMIYKQVQLGRERVLVNKITGRVEQILMDNKYTPISSQRGFGGIPSDQEVYQAQYDKLITGK